MFFKSSLYNPIQNLTMLSSLFRILWLPFVFCGPFILFTSFNETKIGEINIVIPNLKVMKGKIQIGLYNTKESFPKIGKEYKTFRVKVEDATFNYTIKNLPPGEYAIALYHDENSDGVCNSNFFGVPTESYGFSNNIKPFLSAPSFQETKFSLVKARVLSIRLFH